MSSFNQGNSQGGSKDNQQAATGAGKQSDDQRDQASSLVDAGQGAGSEDEAQAFGQVRRADRVPQRQGGNNRQSER